jgi:hypothetical protein
MTTPSIFCKQTQSAVKVVLTFLLINVEQWGLETGKPIPNPEPKIK